MALAAKPEEGTMSRYNCIKKSDFTWDEVIAKLEAGETLSFESASFSSETWAWGDLEDAGLVMRAQEVTGRTYVDKWFVVTADISVQFWGETYTKGMETPHVEHDYS